MLQKISAIIFLGFVSCLSGFSQTYNRPTNNELQPYEFQMSDSTFDQYTLLSPFHINGVQPGSTIPSNLMILDENGYVVWYYSQLGILYTDFKFDSLINAFFTFTTESGFTSSALIDTNFEFIDSLNTVNSVDIDPHDFISFQNGNYLLMGVKDSVFDLSNFSFSGMQGDTNTHVVCNILQEFSSSNQLVWEWNSCDELHPTESYTDAFGYNAAGFDYAHINSVKEFDEHSVIISFRHLNSVVNVNRNTGSVNWRLGGMQSDFTFTNDSGFSGQHDAQVNNGLITLFDNGNMSSNPQTSRAVSYQLDTVNWTANLVDEFVRQPITYGMAMGSYSLSHSFQSVNYGLIYRPSPNVVYLNDQQNEIGSLVFADSVMSYRADLFHPEFDFHRPDIECVEIGGNQFLQVEGDYSEYTWSSGETSKEIIPVINQEYQVWVKKGIGKVGSYPVIYTEDYCLTNSTHEVELAIKSKELEYIVDVYGRIIEKPVIGSFYIYIYDDGSVEKKVFYP